MYTVSYAVTRTDASGQQITVTFTNVPFSDIEAFLLVLSLNPAVNPSIPITVVKS